MLQTLDRPGRLVIWVGMPHFRIPFMVPLWHATFITETFSSGERSSWIGAIVSPDGVWVKNVTTQMGDRGADRRWNLLSIEWSTLITAAVVNAIEQRTR